MALFLIKSINFYFAYSVVIFEEYISLCNDPLRTILIRKYVRSESSVGLQNSIASRSVFIPYALKSKNTGIYAFLTNRS